MIYITGDTHGNIDFNRLKDYFKRKHISRDDYLIILGDAGIAWSKQEIFINEYASLGLTIFFIDGNHENYDLLNNYPIEYKNNSKCHKLNEYIYHIIRGEILIINNLSFLCIGGATSIDRIFRVEGKSWWIDEHITDSDINNAINNLKKYDYKVDYVLSHCAPSKVVINILGFDSDDDTDKLAKIDYYAEYKKWFFGHYHLDLEKDKFRCFYYDVLKIKTKS
ncbi:MAG: metallophosphoesterase [bacterium]|nr:metallophosphoesterase [bacterium]